MKKLLTSILLFVSVSFGQDMPKSLVTTEWGVRIIAYDSTEHRSPQHYERLCRIVFGEFGLAIDTFRIVLIFVDNETAQTLSELSPDKFSIDGWMSRYVFPMFLVVRGVESDGSFIHELLHHLEKWGMILQGAPPANRHQLIYTNEEMMLISKSYVEYVQELTRQ